jgi:transcriptional regulator with XRE-family HTH domain
MGNKRGRSSGDSPLIGVLKAAIRDCGLSLPELSRQTGVSNPQIYRFMSGERSLTLPAAEKLATFLGLKLVKVKGK